MEIIRASNRGICCGVATALFSTERVLKQYSDRPVYMIGDLVHNKYTINKLKKKGVICLNLLKSDRGDKTALLRVIPDKSVIILSAHGSSPLMYDIANKKKLTVIDTTCFYVSKTHKLINEWINRGKHILFVGKKNHDETNAILELGGTHISLIESTNSINTFYQKHKHDITFLRNLVLTNQTTISKYDFKKLLMYALKLMPKIVYYDEICNATTLRQQEIYLHSDENIDLAIVIGDEYSNNALKLLEICSKKITTNSVLISNEHQINVNLLRNVSKIFITASASSPFELIFNIENKINKINNVISHKKNNFYLN